MLEINIMSKLNKSIKSSVILTVLFGYLAIVFYAGIHHHAFTLLPYKGNTGIHLPFKQADHDYEHCEKHFVIHSSISTLHVVAISIVVYKSIIAKPLQTDKLYNCNYFNNSRLRAPPLSC
jgi:hypothetical protein